VAKSKGDLIRERLAGETPADLEPQRMRERFRSVMSTRDGLDFIVDMIAMCNVYSDPFALDPLLMARATGRQELGRILRNTAIEIDHARYLAAEVSRLTRLENA